MLEKICKKEAKPKKKLKSSNSLIHSMIQELFKSKKQKKDTEKETKTKEPIEKEIEDTEIKLKDKEIEHKAIARAYEISKAFWDKYLKQEMYNVFIPNIQYYSQEQDDFWEKHKHVETITYDEIHEMAITMGSNGIVHPSMTEGYKIWSWFEFNRPLRKIYFGVFKVEKFSA